MREFREIRLDLGADGTGDAAAPYISAARVQLGVLKNRMALGGLLQGTLTRWLPDGTRIMVSSSFGRDVVRILATAAVAAALATSTAVSEAPAAEVAPPSVTTSPTPTYVGQGSWYNTNSGTNGYALRWNGGGTPHNLGTADGNIDAAAIGMSDDGTIIAIDASGNTNNEVVVWDKGVLITVPMLHGAIGADPIGVSEKGRVGIASFNRYIGYWESARGLVDLGVNLSGIGMSADGNVFYGYTGVVTPAASYYNVTTLALVTPATIPANSQFTAASKDGSVLAGDYRSGGNIVPFLWANGVKTDLAAPSMQLSPFAISADGKTILLTQYAERVPAGFTQSNGSTNAIYLWSASTGLRFVSAGVGLCLSADGQLIGGTVTANPTSGYNTGAPAVWRPNGHQQTLQLTGSAVTGWVNAIVLPQTP